MSCQVQETDKVSSSQQTHKYLQTDHICFQERKMFLLFAGSPSLGEFLFLNLDIAKFGSNTKTIIKDENSMVMMISDETGEGKMTVHQILPGIMICFTDMHMEQCMSEFELNSGQKVLCIDQCREGLIEMEKIRAIHEQITSNLQVRVTIEELSKQYDMPATSMKKCFREIYGDSIYSYQKRYRMNVAANLLMEDSKVEIQEIALKMGYENPGKFSSAFKSVMGVTPAQYRKH